MPLLTVATLKQIPVFCDEEYLHTWHFVICHIRVTFWLFKTPPRLSCNSFNHAGLFAVKEHFGTFGNSHGSSFTGHCHKCQTSPLPHGELLHLNRLLELRGPGLSHCPSQHHSQSPPSADPSALTLLNDPKSSSSAFLATTQHSESQRSGQTYSRRVTIRWSALVSWCLCSANGQLAVRVGVM